MADSNLHPIMQAVFAPHMPSATPRCYVCGGEVDCWREEAPERAICVECCGKTEKHDGETNHVWTYDRSERDLVCDHCGQFARYTDYYDHADEP